MLVAYLFDCVQNDCDLFTDDAKLSKHVRGTNPQILPSVDIWHLFGLISRIRGVTDCFTAFFSVPVFFLVFSYRLPFHFSFLS